MNDFKPSGSILADALAHHQAGRPAEAEALYRSILKQSPEDSNAWHLLGVLHAENSDHQSGEYFIRSAIALMPAPEYYRNLGLSLMSQSRFGQAVNAFRAATRLNPNYADAHFHLGNLFQILRDPNQSAAAYRQAIAIQPDFAEAHANLGLLLSEVGQLDLAIASFCDAIQHKPDYADAHCNLGLAHQAKGRPGQAAASLSVALAFRPIFPEAWSNLGNAFKEQGLLDRAFTAYRMALTQRADYSGAHSNLLMAQHYAVDCGNADFLTSALEWAERHGAAQPPLPFAAPKDAGGPLRIGYVSGDFNSHPVGYFLESVLAAHDRASVRVICYANNSRSDALTDRLKNAADGWREIVGVGDDAVEALVRQDGIDILVDLSGHTAANRLPLFARRVAPVQVTWLGYFGTTGLRTMDWILADRHVVPPGEERFFTEAVWRLPGSYLCFTPPAEELPIAPPPLLATGVVTFGCFNNRTKITSATVALWAKVLKTLPQSRLMLKARQFGDAGVRQALREQFYAEGVAANRLRMDGETPRSDYLAGYGQIDIALDPLPFGGGTTTAECLWMGVPVLTLRGDRWAGRIGQSFLETLGLADRLVADDGADYVAKAVSLATDTAGLAELRAHLRQRLQHSSLCDGRAFARTLEQAYRSMWQAWRSPSGNRQS